MEKSAEEKIKDLIKKKESHQADRIANKQVVKEHKESLSTKPIINMMSRADMVKGQGVLAVYEEQVALVKELLADDYDVLINASAKADIVHYHTYNPEFLVGLANKKLESFTLGYVHFLPETVDESLDLPNFIRDIYDFYTIQFYKLMDYLVVVNPCFIEPLVSYGIDRENIFYIPNFVNHETFRPLEEERVKAIKESYGLDPDHFTVLGVGQLQTRKGVTDFYEIAKAMPDIQFVWAGGFSFGLISAGHDEIKKLTEDPPANLKFIGIVDREKMNDIYNMGDVMFLPSYAELFPMSILEAMSAERPILIRDLDIYPDILFDFYLKADDNEGFKRELQKLKDDKDYYLEAKRKAKKGSDYYAREHIAAMWKEVYSKILREGSAMRQAKKEKKASKKRKDDDDPFFE